MNRSFTFKGGIHPLRRLHHGKPLSENCAVQELPAPKTVRIPLSQHIGAPAAALVKEGDIVKMGQKIGEACGFVSVPCHSSVSGRVVGIEDIPGITGRPVTAVVIENDGLDTREEAAICNVGAMSGEEIISAVKEAGIVGMGGAAFPTHVKLSLPKDKKVDILIINGAECEPFLTADHRLMLESPGEVIEGIRILMKALGVEKACIGIEDNKKNAVAALEKAAEGTGIDVLEMKTKYPQGSEKQLIYSATGRTVMSGQLPMDAGVVVANVASVKAVYDYFSSGEPLIRRIVTVTGSVGKPSNFLVRIGTSFDDVIGAAGGIKGEAMKIISGGPMMGQPVPSLGCSVVKGTSGILVLGREYVPRREKMTACIQCGKCAAGCPMGLMPMRLAACGEKDMSEQAEEYHAVDCINCGSCSYICPAKRNVSQYVKLAKDLVMLRRAEEKRKREEEKKKEGNA